MKKPFKLKKCTPLLLISLFFLPSCSSLLFEENMRKLDQEKQATYLKEVNFIKAYNDLFDELDRNNNESLSFDEWKNLGIFGTKETSSNLSLETSQLVTFNFLKKTSNKLNRADFKEYAYALITNFFKESPYTTIDKLDKNKNGSISFEEWQGLGVFGVNILPDPNNRMAIYDAQKQTFDLLAFKEKISNKDATEQIRFIIGDLTSTTRYFWSNAYMYKNEKGVK